MSLSLTALDARARRLPDPVVLAVGLAMVAGLAAFKLTAGHGVPLVDFFLVPVAVVAWLARRRLCGYSAALASAATSIVVTLQTGHDRVAATIAAGLARLALYLIAVAVLRAMRAMQEEREHEATTDHLTGVANARAFWSGAWAEIARARRYGRTLSLAYLDIDDFKAINDRLGHVSGDQVLLEVGHVLRSAVRGVDTVARLGGDEFVVLMPETGADEARALVERLRAELGRLATEDGSPVCCSVGLVTCARPPATPVQLVEAADRLMYLAKRNGSDRIEQSELATGLAVAGATGVG